MKKIIITMIAIAFSLSAYSETRTIYVLDEYKSLPSVKKKINELQDVLEREKLSNNVITNIINNYMLNLVPPGTKGVIKGNKFNKEILFHTLSLVSIIYAKAQLYEQKLPYV